ncbi:site-2 protease family protein [Candidatus Bathyarchaeota archaeon]|nr:site-2 protease family protein [Candidatus Bathyarchaeota archaeon]
MNEAPSGTAGAPFVQANFERISTLVSTEFQIEEALMEHNIPTFYLKQPQETKQAFLKLLKNLEAMNLIPILRRQSGRVVLKVIAKLPIKKSNVLINWILFFATIATTFLTGYILSGDITDPIFGGAAFTIALLMILGLHELGHKIAANKKGVDATPPYFIPGPPPIGGFLGIGTFGAVIMQKSLPPNKDALFDIGSSGPIMSFVLAAVFTAIGFVFSPITYSSEQLPTLQVPLLFMLLARVLVPVPIPPSGQYAYIMLHPVAFAGWVGMLVTMLNLLPAAMLDGGHVARSIASEKMTTILTFLSVLLLIVEGFWPMAFFVLFISMYRHPGPLDDVSSLSVSRKAFIFLLIAIFILCSFPPIEL